MSALYFIEWEEKLRKTDEGEWDCADCGGKKKSYHQKWKCSTKRRVCQRVDRVNIRSENDHSQFRSRRAIAKSRKYIFGFFGSFKTVLNGQ